MRAFNTFAIAIVLVTGCSKPSEIPDGNSALGITEFIVTQTDYQTTVSGRDASGSIVARLDLVHGTFTLSPAFADDYDTPEVDGRKLDVVVNGQTMTYEVAGYEPVMNMPPHPTNQWALATFLDDPHVKPILTRWQIGYRPAAIGEALGNDEVAYVPYQILVVETGLPGQTYDCGGQNNCGTANGKTINTCSGGANAIKAQRITQNACLSGYDQYEVLQCCPGGSFSYKTCPLAGLPSACGSVTASTACKGCGVYSAADCDVIKYTFTTSMTCLPTGRDQVRGVDWAWGGTQCSNCREDQVCINGACACPSNCYENTANGCCTVNGTCFVAGTPITMADGTSRPIETLREGELVMAYDTALGRMAPAPITRTFVHDNPDGTVLVNGTLQSTPNHPFYANGEWVRADALRVGDSLVKLAVNPLEGTGAMALSAQATQLSTLQSMPGGQTVYNIEVAGYHTYFAGDVLVHNKEAVNWCNCPL